MKSGKDVRKEILDLVRELYGIEHAPKKFVPGESKVHYAGRVYDADEMTSFVDSALDFWLTMGKHSVAFEKELAKKVGVKHAALTNSGSSANLLAVSALTSPQLKGRIKPGDEAITPAATFPTTFNPLLQNGIVPAVIDSELGTYNIRAEDLEGALSKKTKLIMMPHTLGNPCEMDAITDFAKDHNLFVIEDSCDALDSKYAGKMCGSFGTFGTFSFYAAHHINLGEGGAVATNDDALIRIVRSFREWGRACHCPPGEMAALGACGNRFNFDCGGIPYDHRYMYSHIGYNLKLLDPQAAMGLAQLKKLPRFTAARKKNFTFLYNAMQEFEKYFILPQSLPKAEPSWFAFPLTIKEGAPFTRKDLLTFLESRKIETRLLFAGNILRHPAYKDAKVRVAGTLQNADTIMKHSFFLGVYPGLTQEHLTYVADTMKEFIRKKT